MKDYNIRFKRYIQYTLVLIVLISIGWAVTPYKTVMAGLFIGMSAGLYNLLNMYLKINRFGQAIVEGRNVRSLGMFTRMLTGGLVVLVAIRFPDVFHLVSVVVGIMLVYAIIFIDSLLQVYAFRKEER